MPNKTASRDIGILPNDVIRDPRADAFLIFVTLTENLDEAAVKTWLTGVTQLLEQLEGHQGREDPYASAVFGLGSKFFTRFPQYAANNPAGLNRNLDLPAQLPAGDAFFYIMSTSEQRVADFLTGLWADHPAIVAAVDVERGYQRLPRREAFGQLDGLRVPQSADRPGIVYIDRNVLPEEPAWLEGGSYAAYLKIEQAVTQWKTLDAATQEGVIGRRTADGSRLDLPEGTEARTEPDYADAANPAPTSHIRKTGPRGPVNSENQIFRRGVPYTEARDGAVSTGLQFVSFQASPSYFDITFNHWMRNVDFPTLGAGDDLLLQHNLLNFLKSGLYLIPPTDPRFVAAGYFDAPPMPPKATHGRIHIRKQVLDPSGNPVRADMGGLQFVVLDAATNTQIGPAVFTNPVGQAVTDKIPVGTSVLLREVLAPDGHFEPLPDVTLTVSEAAQVVPVINHLKPQTNPYGA